MQIIFKITILLLIVFGCSAQQLPSYVNNRVPSDETLVEEQISWYNNLVKNPLYDTVLVFRTPNVSSIRYVLIRAENPYDVLRVETSNGRFLYFLTGDRYYFDEVKFDTKGVVVGGLTDIQISGGKMVVQYELCNNCKYGKSTDGT